MAKATKHGGGTNSRAIAPIVTRPKGKGSQQEAPVPAVEPEQGGDDVYDGLTVAELQAELRDRDLPTSGSKAELVDRLLDDDTTPEE